MILKAGRPMDPEIIHKKNIEFYYLLFFTLTHKKILLRCQTCRFSANEQRTEGTHTKYVSLDDKIDGFFITLAT